jgi:hypothetical protein
MVCRKSLARRATTSPGRSCRSTGGAVRIELRQLAANVLFDVPDAVHEEIITLIDAVASDPEAQVADLSAAFGEWCWLVYTAHGDVLEVLDVGCAR